MKEVWQKKLDNHEKNVIITENKNSIFASEMMDLFEIEEPEWVQVEKKEPSKPSFLNDLNKEQCQAVETTEGPVLVLSGAGTGKTKVLTTRIAYILQQQKAMPWQILAVTFTNKASKEMKERLEKMIGADAFSVWLGTFHSIGIRILRKHGSLLGLESNFIVLDSDDQERLLKQMMQEAGVDIKKYTPAGLLDVIQRWKDKGLLPHQVTAMQNSGFCEGRALWFYERYQERLRSLNAVDFGDLLLLPLALFQSHPDVLQQYQKQFHYILVDEYQDTNVAQYLLLRLLAKGHGNICCVGDDDQSIYSWRGAEVENILSFQNVFPDALIIRLERNYRSTAHILGAASHLISFNQGRLGKTLKTADELQDAGEKVKVTGYWSGSQEAEKIIAQIINENKKGIRLSDMAILVRATFQTRQFEEVLIKSGVPYKIIGGFKFYEREEIKDAVAYLRLILNPNDDLAFLRVVNKPRRGVGPQALETLTKTAREKRISLFDAIAWAPLKPLLRKTLDGFISLIKQSQEKMQSAFPAEVARFILNESAYIQMWKQDKSVESQGRVENIMELYTVLDDFKSIEEFIEYASLVTDVDDETSSDQLVVMTLHASKGLEYRHVYLPGWEEGLFPHQKALDESGESGLEEERRLAYVGITRARERAFISFASNRRMYGQTQNALPSRFVDELPKDHIILSPSLNKAFSMDMIEPAWSKGGFFEQNENAYFEKEPNYGNKSKWSRESLNTSDYEINSYNAYSTVPRQIRKSKRIGKRVHHELFGDGTVIKDAGDALEVSFDSVGVKKVKSAFLEELFT